MLGIGARDDKRAARRLVIPRLRLLYAVDCCAPAETLNRAPVAPFLEAFYTLPAYASRRANWSRGSPPIALAPDAAIERRWPIGHDL
jgi:hypothetical protein